MRDHGQIVYSGLGHIRLHFRKQSAVARPVPLFQGTEAAERIASRPGCEVSGEYASGGGTGEVVRMEDRRSRIESLRARRSAIRYLHPLRLSVVDSRKSFHVVMATL